MLDLAQKLGCCEIYDESQDKERLPAIACKKNFDYTISHTWTLPEKIPFEIAPEIGRRALHLLFNM